MRGVSTIKRMLRGDVSPGTAALEAVRRANVSLSRRRERRHLEELKRQPARLTPEFARLSRAELLAHFRSRRSPKFFSGFIDIATTGKLQQQLFPTETEKLIEQANRIANEHCWSLLGFGSKCFGKGEIDWNRDPLSGFQWPLDYHADLNLFRGDGSDARVLWELNRLSHLITLGRAYAVSRDERLSAEFLKQVRSWRRQNPVGLGPNWNCAMEVALRAMNLLAASSLFLHSTTIDEDALAELLTMFDQHGRHIRRNLEFSHIATSNHYMCDVAGLLWLGIMLPELKDASARREFGLRELLNEMDKQILPDGADSESSTGYHRLKLELLLYSLVLCRENGIEIDQKYWAKLRAMAEYTRAYLRPDGRAPLIGDSDSGQVLPIVKRDGDDHTYVLAIADAVFGTHAAGLRTEEALWILGAQGVRNLDSAPSPEATQSKAFPNAGIYILRQDDLYLLFNASGCGLNGRGSHGHNDALSIEVSACGTSFIVDPGSYVYTHDLRERHLFRSTAYHSTVQVDGFEQNTTDQQMPFVMGDEAHPRPVSWEINDEFDLVVAEHDGYERVVPAVTHRRSVRFDKRNRFWLIEDKLTGVGSHEFAFRFHLAPGLETKVTAEAIVDVCDNMNDARLFIAYQELDGKTGHVEPKLEERFASHDYGAKGPSLSVCWRTTAASPLTARFILVPVLPSEDADQRLKLAQAGADF